MCYVAKDNCPLKMFQTDNKVFYYYCLLWLGIVSINQLIKKCIPHIDNQVQHIQE